MATSISSGLGATLGWAAESSVGTFATSTRWPRFNSETLHFERTHVESAGLHQGLNHESKRRAVVQKQAVGGVVMELAYREMGLFFKHMLGSSATATQQGGTTAYLQTHAPGDTKGLSLSAQAGRPFTTGTIQQANYYGLKVLDWTISVQAGAIATLELNLDGWSEETSTSYAAASFVSSPYVADFSQCVVKLGGTPSTTTGVTSISGGAVATGLIYNMTIKGTNSLKTDRYNIGSQVKSEQLVNDFRTYEIDFEIDYATLADVYTSFGADTAVAFQATFTSPQLAGTAKPYYIDIVCPSMSFNDVAVNAGGPDILTQKVTARALDDGTNNVLQVQYQSSDTAI